MSINTYQQDQHEFIKFAIQAGALLFGTFTLQSGRTSPYFFNSGLFDSGTSLSRLGKFYAQAINKYRIDYEILFGAAYKGIPLVSSTVIALANHYQRDVPYTFNRKEIKDHGEGGLLIGAKLEGKVLIIDDVISTGSSIRESVKIIKSIHAHPVGVIIALDRQEYGFNKCSAMQEVEDEYQIPVVSLICLDDLLSYLENNADLSEYLSAVQIYRTKYGV